MTYCVALCVDEGLVFLSDTRTNAGVDNVSAARKMAVFEQPGDRVLTLLCAGNLALTQSVVQRLTEGASVEVVQDAGRAAGQGACLDSAANSHAADVRVASAQRTNVPAADAAGAAPAATLWTASSMVEAARVVGQAVRDVFKRDAQALSDFHVEFNCSFILGGQIGTQKPRLFMIYAAGNFVESTDACPFFQIGESKYGKPIIDRVVTPKTSLDEAAKCALISMDSTLRSNLSVGLPLDLLVYERDALRVSRFAVLDQDNAYYQMIHRSWGERLRQVFGEIPNPVWTDVASAPFHERLDGGVSQALRSHTGRGGQDGAVPAGAHASGEADSAPAQTLAQSDQEPPVQY
ncbi:peptidase [Robbsia sp. KACC 23696]|uniref:peptidase n=1 Tax=Robbsia sp. KACC 23696 TaxID=3149231 RepID=UPI00325B81AC